AADPAAGLVGAVDPKEGAHQHHPLEADVDDAAALGEDAADAGEDERRREDEHAGDQAGVEDVVEVVGARARGEDPERDPEHARGHRPPAEPVLAAADRPDAEGDSEDADEDRPDDRARLDRRDREQQREDAEEHADDAVGARALEELPEAAPELTGGWHARAPALSGARALRRRGVGLVPAAAEGRAPPAASHH